MTLTTILAFLLGAFIMCAIDSVSYKRKLNRLQKDKEEGKEENKTE